MVPLRGTVRMGSTRFERGVVLRIVGPEDGDEGCLAYYTYHGTEYREQPFGVLRDEESFEEALAANGFLREPVHSVGGSRGEFRARVHVAPDAEPPEYLVALLLPGEEDEDWPLAIHVPDWPSLSRFLRGELKELAAVLGGGASVLRLARDRVA
jgi:hypothetical protein